MICLGEVRCCGDVGSGREQHPCLGLVGLLGLEGRRLQAGALSLLSRRPRHPLHRLPRRLMESHDDDDDDVINALRRCRWKGGAWRDVGVVVVVVVGMTMVLSGGAFCRLEH